MQVETFECYETASEPIEASEEAIRLIDEMGLKGQKTFVLGESEQPTRNPYRKWTKDEQQVYIELCPKVYNIQQYDRSPIPLRVLQVAEHARKYLPKDYKLFVIDKAEIQVKDPVLVAAKYDWDLGKETYILARWGEHLDNFQKMLKQAIDSKRKRLRSLLKTALSEVDNSESVLDLTYDLK
jgi:hypothetical protein